MQHPPMSLVLLAPTLLMTFAGPARSDALHAPRVERGLIQRITNAAGCEGPTGNNPLLYSKDARYQAYVCRSVGTSVAYLFDSRRRQNIPMFAIGAGNAVPLWVSDKGTKVAILSDVPLAEADAPNQPRTRPHRHRTAA